MGARASHLKEFKRFNKRIHPAFLLPIGHPVRDQAVMDHGEWEEFLFYRKGRKRSTVKRRAYRRWVKSITRRIRSGRMRPRDRMYHSRLHELRPMAEKIAANVIQFAKSIRGAIESLGKFTS